MARTLHCAAAMWRTFVIILLVGCAGATEVATSSDVAIVVEPNGMHGEELIDAIRGAQREIDVEVYQLGDDRVVDALVERARSGVPITVVLDGAQANRSWNQAAYDRLHAAGARVAWSNPAFAYTHTKCVVVDDEAWIMTMNLDYTSSIDNREYLAIDRARADVAEARAIIAADLAQRPIEPAGDLVVANANARERLASLIDGARVSLEVEVEELGDAGNAGAIARAASGGVRVRVALAREDLAPWQLDAAQAIVRAGGGVVESGPDADHRDGGHPYLHAKAIVVDGQTAFVGSENLSSGSLGHNREIGVVLGDASEIGKIEAAFATDFAAGTPLGL